MKKLLYGILTGSLVLAMLTGCGIASKGGASLMGALLSKALDPSGGNDPDREDDPDTDIDTDTDTDGDKDPVPGIVTGKKVELGTLIGFEYSPGYSDMNGGYHSEVLEKDEYGNWIIVSSHQESIEEDTIITTYAVSDEDVAAFEAFIKDRNIVALKDRPDSDDFITDYHQWNYRIRFDNSALGGESYESYSFSGYQEFTEDDYAIMEELDALFDGMYGEVVSEVVERSEYGAFNYYRSIYEPVLDEVFDVIENGYDFEADYQYLSTGIMEKVMYEDKEELLQNIGYVIEDINYDGIPELLIGENGVCGDGECTYIYSGFTLPSEDAEEPVMFLEGWERSSYQWLGDGHFYHWGSGGVSNTMFGECHLEPSETELSWDDFWFFYEYSDGTKGFYHNLTGECDESVSEKLDISEDDFWRIPDGYRFVILDLWTL